MIYIAPKSRGESGRIVWQCRWLSDDWWSEFGDSAVNLSLAHYGSKFSVNLIFVEIFWNYQQQAGKFSGCSQWEWHWQSTTVDLDENMHTSGVFRILKLWAGLGLTIPPPFLPSSPPFLFSNCEWRSKQISGKIGRNFLTQRSLSLSVIWRPSPRPRGSARRKTASSLILRGHF